MIFTSWNKLANLVTEILQNSNSCRCTMNQNYAADTIGMQECKTADDICSSSFTERNARSSIHFVQNTSQIFSHLCQSWKVVSDIWCIVLLFNKKWYTVKSLIERHVLLIFKAQNFSKIIRISPDVIREKVCASNRGGRQLEVLRHVTSLKGDWSRQSLNIFVNICLLF